MTGHPVAEVRGLRLTITAADGAQVRALRGVDLTIDRSEVVALVGESGSGKSVLGAALLGLLPDARRADVAGTVTVDGHDMLAGPARERREVRRHLLGAVFQDPLTALNPTMRVGRQLGERGLDAVQAAAALREVGVPDAAARLRAWPHQLSGGLRQRVTLAMALGARGRLAGDSEEPGPELGSIPAPGRDGAPLLVVADEPTTALDVSVQAQVVLLLDRVRRDHGCSVLLVTHDLGVAASVADRVVVLYGGKVLEQGPTADLVHRPRHPYTAGLLGARLSVEGDAAPTAIRGAPPDPRDPPAGCPFAPRCDRVTEACTSAMPPLEGGVACFHPLTDGGQPVPVQEPVSVAVRDAAPQPPAGSGATPPPAVELRDVRKAFRVPGGLLHAVAGVDLAVPAGGSVALVGESGCGKTTLLRLATGLTAPDAGTVTWPGTRPQLVFQDAGSSLTPWLKVGRQVEERLRRTGTPRAESAERAAELLRLVGLDGRAARSRPRELSGGQRQRAAIARALASQPRLLVCDEPVSALDASLAVRVLDLLTGLREELGLALLVVTHDLAAARYVGDEVSVMYLGRIVERAPARPLFDAPLHPYTQGLRAAVPTTEPGRLAPSLEGEPPSPVGEPDGCAFRSRCAHAVDACSVAPTLRRPQADDATSARWVACHVALGDAAAPAPAVVPSGVAR
jgi:peptide/nickel transport system ATP-binding protein